MLISCNLEYIILSSRLSVLRFANFKNCKKIYPKRMQLLVQISTNVLKVLVSYYL